MGDAVGWGFVVRGGRPCHIQAVEPCGPAAAAGLKVGILGKPSRGADESRLMLKSSDLLPAGLSVCGFRQRAERPEPGLPHRQPPDPDGTQDDGDGGDGGDGALTCQDGRMTQEEGHEEATSSRILVMRQETDG